MKFTGLILWALVLLTIVFQPVGAQTPDFTLNPDRVEPGPDQTAELTIRSGGRYAIHLESDSGAALQLVDRIMGHGPVSGIAGYRDGRIDAFLDPGMYRLRIEGDTRDTHPVRIRVSPVTADPSERRPLPSGEALTELELRDFQVREFWFTLQQKKDLYIEAAGRALSDMRLWEAGVFLTGDRPIVTRSEATPGQPMNICRFAVTCPPGTYRLALYGGQPLVWSVRSAEFPLYLRSGIPVLPGAGVSDSSVSIFGEDVFKIPEGSDFFRLDARTPGTAFSIKPFERKIYPGSFQESRSIQDIKKPYVEWREPTADSAKLVRISGASGTPYSLRWFKTLHTENVGSLEPGSFNLHVIQGGRPRDLPELNALVVEVPDRRDSPPRLIARSTTMSGPETPFVRRFNVNGTVSFYLELTDEGLYRLESRGIQARFILEPLLLTKPGDYVRPLPESFPHTRSTTPGLYLLTILPDSPGALDLAVVYGDQPVRWPSSFTSEPTPDGHIIFENLAFSRDHSYRILTNGTGAPAGYGLLPTDSAEPPGSRILSPGDTAVDFSASRSPRISDLPLNDPVLLNLSPDASGRMRCRIDTPGIYRLEIDTVGDVETAFRTMMKTSLDGWNRTGHRHVFQNYLIPGDYYLEYAVSKQYFGMFNIQLNAIETYSTGALVPGETCRMDTAVPGIPVIELTVDHTGDYRMACRSVHGPCSLRVETRDRWPVVPLQTDHETLEELPAGMYRLFPMIRPGMTACQLHVTSDDGVKPVQGPGPHVLSLSRGGYGTWMQEEGIREHIWMFTLNAATHLSISLSHGMEGRLEKPADSSMSPIPIIAGSSWNGSLGAGEYRLNVASSIPDSMKPYHVKVRTDPLVSGGRCTIPCPGKVRINMQTGSGDGNVTANHHMPPALIMVEGSRDTRAVLADAEGRTVDVVDDVPGDWNPILVIPGDYRTGDTPDPTDTFEHTLFVNPLEDTGTDVEIAYYEPPSVSQRIPLDETVTVTPNGHAMQLYPEGTLLNNYWLVESRCRGVYAIVPGGVVSGNVVTVIPPGVPVMDLVDIDRRNQDIAVFSRSVALNPLMETEGGIPFRWETVSMGVSKVYLAEIQAARPGVFTLEPSFMDAAIRVGWDDNAFRPLSAAGPNISVTNTLRLVWTTMSRGKPPNMKVSRAILNRRTPKVTVPGNAVIDVELNHGETGLVTVDTGDSIHHMMKGPGGRHRVDLTDFPTDALAVENTSVTLSAFPETAMNRSEEKYGSIQLGSGHAVQLFYGNGNRPPVTGSEPGTVRIQTDDSCWILNPGPDEKGVAWRPADQAGVELPIRELNPGMGTRVFLAPGMSQSYRFSVGRRGRIGIAVQSSGGCVRAELLPAGTSSPSSRAPVPTDRQGLIMNPVLDPGSYRLKVYLSSEDAAASVRPVLIQDPPESLILFGKEEL